MLRFVCFVLCAAAIPPGFVRAKTRLDTRTIPHKLLNLAFSSDPIRSRKAIARLRTHGPKSLIALRRMSRTLSAQKRRRFPRILDKVAGQYRSEKSGLFWFTDLRQARRYARSHRKPILSLRLLGNLDEAYTCANSRFFRTALYTDPTIAAHLRKAYVLHWKSVRPVPIITIDYGGGRRLKRTITGNSIHYVLDHKGRLVDALPGLYGPGAFRRFLRQAGQAARHASTLRTGAYRSWLVRYHRKRYKAATQRWHRMLAGAKMSPTLARQLRTYPSRRVRLHDGIQLRSGVRKAGKPVQIPPRPSALLAARVAVTKSKVEFPTLAQMRLRRYLRERTRFLRANAKQIRALRSQIPWPSLAAHFRKDSRLSHASIARIRQEYKDVTAFGFAKRYQRRKQGWLRMMVVRFENALALDSVKNEFLHRLRLHAWLAAGRRPNSLQTLNRQIYARIFLTPHTDPWLGMLPRFAYSALPNGGVRLR